MNNEVEKLINSVLIWWEEHKYDAAGEHGDHNIFDEEPDFVTLAKRMSENEQSQYERVRSDEIEVKIKVTEKIALNIAKHLKKDLSDIHLDLKNPIYVGNLIEEILIEEY